jgi:NADPH-dependent 2,4-dienoyl-CoA reductase/sulfur reductase-like enzyme
MKIAIIGAVAAGTSAAAKARRTNKEAEIVVFEKDTDISYAGCGLPYYISGVIEERDQLLAFKAESFAEKYGVEVKTAHEVKEIDPDQKVLYYRDLNDGSEGGYEYDKLIIATGATPIAPPFAGLELDNISIMPN